MIDRVIMQSRPCCSGPKLPPVGSESDIFGTLELPEGSFFFEAGTRLLQEGVCLQRTIFFGDSGDPSSCSTTKPVQILEDWQ